MPQLLQLPRQLLTAPQRGHQAMGLAAARRRAPAAATPSSLCAQCALPRPAAVHSRVLQVVLLSWLCAGVKQHH